MAPVLVSVNLVIAEHLFWCSYERKKSEKQKQKPFITETTLNV